MMNVVRIWSVVMLLGLSSTLSYAQNENTTSIERSAYAVNPQKAATDYYLRGKEVLITTRDVKKACSYFLQALKADPDHGASNYELSLIAAPEKALEFCLKAYQSDTTNYWYQGQLATIYLAMKNLPKAIEIGEKMIKTDPTDDESYKQLASYYFYNNESAKAMSLVDTIVTRFGESPETALLYANMVKNMDSPSADMLKKVQDYAKLYEDIPHFALVLGDIYLKMGLNDRALLCYHKVKNIDPEDLRGDVALFDYYNRRRNQTEAVKYLGSLFKFKEIDVEAKIDLYREMISTNIYLYRNSFNDVDNASMSLVLTYHDNIEVRKLYSDHLLKKGDVQGALLFNKAGMESGYVDAESLTMIIEIEAYYKHFDSVKVYIEKGLNLFPEKKADFNMAKVSLYTMTKEHTKAIDLINKEMIKGEKNDSLLSIYYGVLGDIYHTDGKNKLAYKAYDKSLRYDAVNVVVLNNYSYYLALENKNLEKALMMSLMVMQKEPSNSTYIDTYAWVLFKLGRYKEAREVVAKAVALDTTKSSSLVLHYGDILDKLNERSLAEIYWLKALEYGEDEKEIVQRMGENDPRVKEIKEKKKLNNDSL